MQRKPQTENKPIPSDVGTDLLTLVLLVLVGLGFTLMSATAFAITGS